MSIDLGKLFGKGGTAEQLLVWGILAQVMGAVLAPELEELQRGVRSLLQSVPLTPEQLADMVVRNIVSAGDGEAYAKQSGIAPSDFQRLTQSAGEPPSPQEMLAALRRGIVEARGRGPQSTSVEQAVAESRIYNKYLPVLEALADLPIGPADAVDAAVKGQISYEAGQAEAFLSGINAQRYKILTDTRGNPPSSSEAAELLKRKLIPLEGVGPDQTSFQQAIYEGATKNKWWKLFAALADYIPPPRTVTAMVRSGALTDDRALQLYQASGLDQELAADYLTDAHHQKTQAERDLTVSLIKSLYQDGLISPAESGQFLQVMRYSAEDVALLHDLWDFENLQTKIRTAVSKIHSLYVAHKIDATEAGTALDGFGVPPAGKQEYLTVWNLERDANVPRLTRAEIVDAWFYGVIDTDAEADQLLEQLGWSPAEAAILRGIRAHGKERPTAG